MGAYNTVHIRYRSSQVNAFFDLKIQFKYGDTWQYAYKIGDTIKWGGNDIGEKTAKRVVVDGHLDCPVIATDIPEGFEVHILNGKIDRVVPATGSFDFAKIGESFIIIEK